ncbi:sulfite oxidase [Phytohabitans flavus]|uniref:Oxidoreductase n=1 Tax=Phytohabitans flavus TaxID=1076124 RepID=A0A6F8Y5X2_9ACTN|nr:molybdopterin-dependent oxidoreductase [Phytohabitans flavus]BCB81460.1 oxidoreductase [Phytohabitans flavus]
MRNGVRGALAGVVAAAVALGLAEFVAVFTGARSAPLVAVGGVVVDHVPEPLKQFAIDVFGTHDKTALLVGTVVLLAAFAALIGWLAVRNIWFGVAGIAIFGLVGVAAAVTRPDAGAGAAVPSLLGAAVAGLVLWRLLAGPAEPGDSADRRRFLTNVAVVAGVAAVSGLGGRWLATRRTVTEARRAVRLPVPASPAPAVPSGSDLSLTQLAPYVTSNRDFYRIDTALVLPQVDPASWTLRIHGRVRNPVTLTFDQLLARPMVERYVTLACVSNEVGGDLIGNARWLGVPLKELLEEAQPLEGADQVVGRSADGWTCGTPTAVLLDGRDALLAVGMNGEPLPIQHGFPARMVVPGLYGYVSACKWITELELTSFADFDAYWVPRGWSAQGPIKTESRIDTPRSRNNLSAGPVTVAGVAWAQHRGIRKVEVRVDGGPWQEATLARSVSIDTWVQWSWRWEATSGKHRLQVRATDATGYVQTEEERPPAPDGATGWHSVDVEVG